MFKSDDLVECIDDSGLSNKDPLIGKNYRVKHIFDKLLDLHGFDRKAYKVDRFKKVCVEDTIPPFNKLTPGEIERLSMLAEEAGEVIQIIGKILRHGWNSCHPNSPNGPNNRTLLEYEIDDFNAVLRMMNNSRDIDTYVSEQKYNDIINKKLKYTHHQTNK